MQDPNPELFHFLAKPDLSKHQNARKLQIYTFANCNFLFQAFDRFKDLHTVHKKNKAGSLAIVCMTYSKNAGH